jgi:hypothetical protein
VRDPAANGDRLTDVVTELSDSRSCFGH